MKIDNVLARHPWPWSFYMQEPALQWSFMDADSHYVNWDSNGMLGEIRDAILELIEAHVNRTTTQRTHSATCWQWHLECAVSKIKGMSKEKP